MLFALLFDARDQLVAAAPAIDVHQFGSNYWREVYMQPLTPGPGSHTAFVEIGDPILIDQLNSLVHGDEFLLVSRAALEQLLTTREDAAPPSPDKRQPRAA